MPTVSGVAARIRREGQTVTFTSANGSLDGSLTDQTDTTLTDQDGVALTTGAKTATIKAFVRGYAPQQLVGDVQQGDRVLHVAPADLPWLPDQPDRVAIGDEITVVQTTETRTLRGVPCMHVIQVRGG